MLNKTTCDIGHLPHVAVLLRPIVYSVSQCFLCGLVRGTTSKTRHARVPIILGPRLLTWIEPNVNPFWFSSLCPVTRALMCPSGFRSCTEIIPGARVSCARPLRSGSSKESHHSAKFTAASRACSRLRDMFPLSDVNADSMVATNRPCSQCCCRSPCQCPALQRFLGCQQDLHGNATAPVNKRTVLETMVSLISSSCHGENKPPQLACMPHSHTCGCHM